MRQSTLTGHTKGEHRYAYKFMPKKRVFLQADQKIAVVGYVLDAYR